jgi:hypothetical protein
VLVGYQRDGRNEEEIMSARTRKQAKKSGGASAAVVNRPVAPVSEVAVRNTLLVAGITLDGGKASIALSLDVPAPTMRENEKYPWTPWNVEYLRKQLDKDLCRVAQTISNYQYVAGLIESRAAERTAARAQKPTVEQAQPAGERPSVAQ